MTESQTMFFARLSALGTGERAALRRNAGNMLRQADGSAITAFYRCLPTQTDRWQEDRWFAVACLSCLWDAEHTGTTPLEQIIASLIRKEMLSESTRHRVELLLDTDWDADGYMLTKLTRLVKLVRQKSDRTYIDFAALLEDLLYWNAETQSVQRKWAKAIFANETENKEEDKENA